MTRTSIISLIVLIIIVVAGIWYWTMGVAPTTQTTMGTESSSTSETATDNTASPGTASTLGTLVAQGGNYTCTLYTLSDSGQVRGTLYGSGGETRMDLVSSVNGNDVTMHVIHENGYTYTWVDGQQTGTKVAVATGVGPVQPTGGVISVSDTSQVSSSCIPWVPVASQFIPPTAITFVAH